MSANNNKPSIALEHEVQVYETQDYERFRFMPGNRETSEAHVEQIVRSMKLHGNLLNLYPIIVSPIKGKKNLLEIHDGQHRFLAAKRLRLTVFYIEDRGGAMTLQTVIDANAVQWSWTYKDFLHSYCERGFEEYHAVRRYIDTYPISLGHALQLLAGGSNATWGTDFKRGTFKCREWDFACQMGEAVQEFSAFVPVATTGTFIKALAYLMRNPKYSHEQMRQKMQMAYHVIDKTTDADQYFRQLVQIYNYKNHEKNVETFDMIDNRGRVRRGGRWVSNLLGDAQ